MYTYIHFFLIHLTLDPRKVQPLPGFQLLPAFPRSVTRAVDSDTNGIDMEKP